MRPWVLLIDNYDSFVFNLARYFEELGVTAVVRRNDEVTVAEIAWLAPGAVVLSPGPCTPNEAGICLDVVKELGSRIPILGVCLGHQAIGAACGGDVVRAHEPVHGRTSMIEHGGRGIFAGCENPFRVTRYHSLVVDSATLPDCLSVTARTRDGTIMALQHREWPVYGVQFHPESILTKQGHQLLRNFLKLAGIPVLDFLPQGDLPVEDGADDDFYRRAIDPAVFRPL
ncbi:anthranilate synthase component II [Planctomicrobium sp. SH661]|uniref:anthranilate synthase component II n=1 Tax=Planctomicrobium sp. SH661 TaxID=3448124 RepID=UPI003F5B980A